MILACVRTGTRYPIAYVEKWRNMVLRNMPDIAFMMVCLTDQPERVEGVNFIDVATYRLPKWWPKMLLFQKPWRAGHSVLYIDLDSVILSHLGPLTGLRATFAVCANFARLHGNRKWPCRYSSAVMFMRHDFGEDLWLDFQRDGERLMREFEVYGDQRVIEVLHPDADLLQPILPSGYLLSYRDLPAKMPDGAGIINFGGPSKPDNCTIPWVQRAWR